MRNPDEGIALFVDDIPRRAGMRINLDQPEALMATIGLLISKVSAVFPPAQPRAKPLVLEAIQLRLDLLSAC
jgi:hypothetical protein